MDGIEKVEKPISPIMPIMGNLMANAMPAPVPQMAWETGVISDFLHNWKLGRVEKATQRESSIAVNKDRMVTANLNIMFNLMTFSGKVEDQFDQFRHFKEMRKAELTAQQLTNMGLQLNIQILQEKSKEEIEQIRLKNETLKGEVKLNDIEVKIRMKQLEELLNGTS